MTRAKKKIAVFFGGRSPEHDVSVVTGLQILQAIDTAKYEAFPVYVGPDGEWRTGDVLRTRANYLLDDSLKAQTTTVTLDVKPGRGGRLIPTKFKMLSKPKVIEFDAAIPAFHGLYGEDGNFQGMFEFANIPYAGMRTMASSILMDKAATKKILIAAGVPVLTYAVITRPESGYMIEEGSLSSMMGDVRFPCIVKPSHLGSSIGVAKANSVEEVRACLPAIFQYDEAAIVEPFVEI
jgi:D-alanine-D-alanine ligase